MAPPQLVIAGSGPSAEEAAAIAAAIALFESETAPSDGAEPERRDPWFFAGLLDATGNDSTNPFQSHFNL